MEHIFRNNDELPMYFIVDRKNKILHFVTDDLVMPNDTVSGCGITGTIKEIVSETAAKGKYLGRDDDPPPRYVVKLY